MRNGYCKDVKEAAERWKMDAGMVREQAIRAATARDRERWQVIWLALQGRSRAQIAKEVGHDQHTLGKWIRRFRQQGPMGLQYVHTGGNTQVLDAHQKEELRQAVEQAPRAAGIEAATWQAKSVALFIGERFGITLSPSGCEKYLHRLGFVLKRPKKRLLKADAAKRDAFVVQYAQLRREAEQTGASVFFRG